MSIVHENLPWYHKPRYIAVATCSTVMAAIIFLAVFLICDTSWDYGDYELDHKSSPDGKYTAWVIGRGRSGSDGSDSVVVVTHSNSVPQKDDNGNVQDYVLRCPEASGLPGVSWSGSRNLTISEWNLNDGGIKLDQQKWEEVQISLSQK